MANNAEIVQGLSNHNRETSSDVQPNASYQTLPLQPLEVVIEQQTEQSTGGGCGYIQCPLYDTRYGSVGNQLSEETSFTQAPVSPDSCDHITNEQ